MVKLVILCKSGEINELDVKKLTINDLYKKCNYRKPDGFGLINIWKVNISEQTYVVEVYGKKEGKSGHENKHELPPPIDKELYFGNLAIINKNSDDELADIGEKEWLMIYDKLYGGFEDLAATAKEDDMEVDELENVPKEFKTTEGYLKDGFVVDDDNECEYDSELDYEEYEYSDEDFDYDK